MREGFAFVSNPNKMQYCSFSPTFLCMYFVSCMRRPGCVPVALLLPAACIPQQCCSHNAAILVDWISVSLSWLNFYLFYMHPQGSTYIILTLLSHLRPRFSYVLGHYGHARSRRRASARRGDPPPPFKHTWQNTWNLVYSNTACFFIQKHYRTYVPVPTDWSEPGIHELGPGPRRSWSNRLVILVYMHTW